MLEACQDNYVRGSMRQHLGIKTFAIGIITSPPSIRPDIEIFKKSKISPDVNTGDFRFTDGFQGQNRERQEPAHASNCSRLDWLVWNRFV